MVWFGSRLYSVAGTVLRHLGSNNPPVSALQIAGITGAPPCVAPVFALLYACGPALLMHLQVLHMASLVSSPVHGNDTVNETGGALSLIEEAERNPQAIR